VGTAKFSDIPMNRPLDEDLYHEFFKTKHTTRYLEDYVDQQKHAGQTLRSRIRFGIEIHSVRKIDGVWVVSAREKPVGIQKSFIARS